MAGRNPRRLGRSALAVLLGFVAGAVVSLGTDEVLHVLRSIRRGVAMFDRACWCWRYRIASFTVWREVTLPRSSHHVIRCAMR